MSVRITAAGAVAVVCFSFLTAPVSACDERYIKKCERAAAAVAAAEEAATTTAPAAKRKSAGRVEVVASRRSKHTRFVKRTRAPGFTAKRERGSTLASAESRMTTPAPESPLARRFRGFINPRPLAQNAFEALRKPHIVADNLEPPVAVESPPAPASAGPAKAAAMELASADSRPVTLPEPPAAAAKPLPIASANAAPAPAVAQAFVSETPPSLPTDPQPSRFSLHQLVLALCGALGAAGALRFIVGA